MLKLLHADCNRNGAIAKRLLSYKLCWKCNLAECIITNWQSPLI